VITPRRTAITASPRSIEGTMTGTRTEKAINPYNMLNQDGLTSADGINIKALYNEDEDRRHDPFGL
jgi:hypothetical protein